MTDPSIQAYLDTAAHFGVPVHMLTRAQVREARELGIHSVSERKLGPHTKIRERASAEAGTAEEPPLPPIPEGQRIKGVSTFVDSEGNTRGQWIKTALIPETREEILARLVRDLPAIVAARESPIPAPAGPLPDEILAVYPMGDPHLGLLSWAPETGESFDLETAARLMRGAIEELTSRGRPARRALVVNLGDFFHSDLMDNRTRRAGHALDVDGRWARVLRVGLDAMIFTIECALQHHERVDVICAIGNHDDHSAMFLAVALAAHFRNEPRVHIETSPAAFHYYLWGKNLLGITHGHTVKAENLEAIMAADRPQEWGLTTHRWWLCGHVHHSSRKDLRASTVETFRTLAARDAWAHASGYRARRDMQRVELHAEWGEIGRETVSAQYLEALFNARSVAN